MKIDILNLAASTNYAQTKLESKLLISLKLEKIIKSKNGKIL